MAEATKKYAVVTGANKGIGFEICKQLVSQGVTVVLTARDEKRGLEALEKLNKELPQFPDSVTFHALDVKDSASVASLAEFLKSRFGKLDILVNNAAINGAQFDGDAVRDAFAAIRASAGTEKREGGWNANAKVTHLTPDLATEAFQTNYYGAKRTVQAFLPLLHSSSSPRIVNVTSSIGQLKNIQNDWARGILGDAENLTEERIDQVLNEFLKDLKDHSLEAKGWPRFFGAYVVSKAALNAYTRIIAGKYGDFRINCVCPGSVPTDINMHQGTCTVEEGGKGPVRLALLPDDGPSGFFFRQNEVASFEGY